MGTKTKTASLEQVDEAVEDRRIRFDDGFDSDLIIDHVADAILIVDSMGAIRKINKQTESYFNYSQDELIGQKIEQLIPERFHHEHVNNRKTYISNPHTRPMGIGIDLTARRKDGTEFPCEASLSPITIANEQYTICTLRDITEFKKIKLATIESEKRYKSLVSSSPYCIHEIDLDGQLISMNPAGLEMMGINDLCELNDSLYINIVCKDHHERINKLMTLAFRGSESEFEFTSKDGSIFQSCFVPITNGAGVITHLMGITQDVTNRKQAEEELKKQRENMAHLVRVQALGEMTAGIAHEINQPLAAINSYAEASKKHLQSGESRTEKLMELTGKISNQAKRAGSIVGHLRAMMQNKISSPVALDINNLLMDIVDLAEIETRSNDCKLIFKYSRSLPNVVCDGIQIQQVALNLISNAVEAMHDTASDVEKNITIEIRAKDNNYVEVCVTDNGSGVNVQDAGNIYEAFYTTKDSGLGMGLSICQSIIENHGGELGYSQNEAGGSRFCFSLPVEKSE